MISCIGLVTNEDKDPGLQYTGQIREFLEARGINVYSGSAPELAANLNPGEFWVVLGGDGTILRAAHFAAIRDIPMLGINLGTMGFLTDADREDGFMSLDKAIKGQFVKERRLMILADDLSGQHGNHQSNPDRLALNDIYLLRSGRLMEYTLLINGEYLDKIRADGVIVATPTGSTAYNLSAGGPILVPYGEMMVITAVCPHSLSARPWVVSAKDTVRIYPSEEVPVWFDGVEQLSVSPPVGIEIRCAPYQATILKTSTTNFLDVLRKKKVV